MARLGMPVRRGCVVSPAINKLHRQLKSRFLLLLTISLSLKRLWVKMAVHKLTT